MTREGGSHFMVPSCPLTDEPAYSTFGTSTLTLFIFSFSLRLQARLSEEEKAGMCAMMRRTFQGDS